MGGWDVRRERVGGEEDCVETAPAETGDADLKCGGCKCASWWGRAYGHEKFGDYGDGGTTAAMEEER